MDCGAGFHCGFAFAVDCGLAYGVCLGCASVHLGSACVYWGSASWGGLDSVCAFYWDSSSVCLGSASFYWDSASAAVAGYDFSFAAGSGFFFAAGSGFSFVGGCGFAVAAGFGFASAADCDSFDVCWDSSLLASGCCCAFSAVMGFVVGCWGFSFVLCSCSSLVFGQDCDPVLVVLWDFGAGCSAVAYCGCPCAADCRPASRRWGCVRNHWPALSRLASFASFPPLFFVVLSQP